LATLTLTTKATTTEELENDTDITSGTTYLINNAEQLGYLADIVNGGETCAGATFLLTGDIELNEGVDFSFDADTGLVEATSGSETFY
jgi:hypothetical protein